MRYSDSKKRLFTLLWILSVPKIPCYELEGINQCNWVCKCRIKAEFKLFSALQHFFENSILFIFSNKQLFFSQHFMFTTSVALGCFLPFFTCTDWTVMIDQSDPDHQSLSTLQSLSWQLDTEVVTLLTLCSPQLTSCWGRSNRASASGSRSGDLGNVARTRGQTLPSQSTLNRPKNTMEISLYWPCLMLGDTGGHHGDENIHESSGSEQSGPRVIVKYFNTTLGTKTFLPKKVNKHKSFSVLWGKETKYTIYNGVFEIWHDKRM